MLFCTYREAEQCLQSLRVLVCLLHMECSNTGHTALTLFSRAVQAALELTNLVHIFSPSAFGSTQAVLLPNTHMHMTLTQSISPVAHKDLVTNMAGL